MCGIYYPLNIYQAVYYYVMLITLLLVVSPCKHKAKVMIGAKKIVRNIIFPLCEPY